MLSIFTSAWGFNLGERLLPHFASNTHIDLTINLSGFRGWAARLGGDNLQRSFSASLKLKIMAYSWMKSTLVYNQEMDEARKFEPHSAWRGFPACDRP